MNKWVIGLTLLLIGGCASDSGKSISYYHFDIDKAATVSHTTFSKPRLEIIPINLPEHLNARGIAQRVNQYRTVNANWHLWSSQPGTMLDRAALNQLEQHLPDWFVIGAEEPWLIENLKAPKKIVKLQFVLERFNGGLENNAEIVGSWTLFDAQDQLLMRQNFSQTVTLENNGYDALTAALQSGWEAVCTNVASEISASFK